MKRKAKRSSALTSAVAAVSALVLAAGLSLPTTLAFAGGDAADPERPAGDVNDVLLDESEADQAAEVAEDGTVTDVDETNGQDAVSGEGDSQNGAGDGQESEANPSSPEAGTAPDDQTGAVYAPDKFSFTVNQQTVDDQGGKHLTYDLSQAWVSIITLSMPEGASYQIEYASSDPSIASVDDEGVETYIYGHAVGTCTITATATDAATGARYYDTIEVSVVNEIAQEYPSPYNEDKSLKPHTVSNGVLTFDDPALGSWYALTVETGEGVDCTGVVYGGGLGWEMTIRADQLDPSDEGYSSDPYHGPFFVRGNNGGAYSSIAFEVEGEDGWTEDMKLLQGSLSPSGAGVISSYQSPRIWAVQLNAPATLRVSVAGEGESVDLPIASEIPGASASIPAANLKEQSLFNTLTLVSGELSEEKAADAEGAVVAALGDPLNIQAFDLHLQGSDGKEFPVPDGKTVTVTLPIPDDWAIGDVRVLHVADDGTVTDMNATVNAAERTVTFTTTHFSTFVMANYPAQTVEQTSDTVKPLTTDDASGLAKTGDSPAPLAAVAAVAALAAAGAAGIALRRRG